MKQTSEFQILAVSLATAITLAGCTSTTGTNVTAAAGLSTTQATDASASLEGLSLVDQIADAIGASVSATGDTGFTIAQASAKPSAAPSTPTRGKPTGSLSSTTITTDSTTTSVVHSVSLGGTGTKVSGSNKITRVFKGVVSQTTNVPAALKEIRDKSFELQSVTHEMSLTNPKGTRTSTRTCTFGTTVTCTTTGESTNVKATASTTINKSDKSESGSGTVTHKKSNKTRNLTITRNADGSSTFTIVNPAGITLTLNKAADGTVTGTVVKNGTTLATISANANGDLETSDGSANETSDKAADDVS